LDVEQMAKNKCVKYAVGSFWYETQDMVCFNEQYRSITKVVYFYKKVKLKKK